MTNRQTVGLLAAARKSTTGNVAPGSPFSVAQAVTTGAALPFSAYTGAAIAGAAAFGAGYAAVKNHTERHECSKCSERGSEHIMRTKL